MTKNIGKKIENNIATKSKYDAESYNKKVLKGEILLEVQNGDKNTPQVPWSGNLMEYRYDPEVDFFPEGWGLIQLDNGQIVQTNIHDGPAFAYIISKREAITQIVAHEKYELLKKFDLTNELFGILRGWVK